MIDILKVLVGSQAHGLATPQSDYDYRGVFVIPTTELLKLGVKNSSTSWIEDKDDDTSWEVGHFLNLAVRSNPTILETFLAPRMIYMTGEEHRNDKLGRELQELFPYVWNSEGVLKSFLGYGKNQRVKFFENKDKRASKYAVAYLRTLYQGWELLTKGTFTIRVADTEIGEALKYWKSLGVGDFPENEVGYVIETCYKWENKLKKAYEDNPNKETNTDAVNEFLLKVRKEFWE